MKWAVLSAALIIGVSFPCCHSRSELQPYSEEDILARIGDEVILKDELTEELTRRGLERRPEVEAQILEEMIQFRRLVLEGRSRGWHQDQEAKRAFDRFVAQRVSAQHDDPENDSIITVTDEEIRETYEQRNADYQQGDSVRGAILFVRGEIEKAKFILTKTLIQIDQIEGHDFGKLAVTISHDQATRYRGGQMRWVNEKQRKTNRWGTAVMDALFALETPGETSNVIALEDGACVVRLIERQEGQVTPLDKVAVEIKARLIKQKKASKKDAFQENLAKKFPAKIS